VRIVHVVPTPFGPGGLLGGGERYPLELARALARRVDCELVTFGLASRRFVDSSGLRITVLRRLLLLRGHPVQPLAPQLAWTLDGDVVHTHQLRSAPSRLAAVVAAVRRTPLVTTDHGLGGGGWYGLLPALFDRFLTVSAYSAQTLDAPSDKARVIYGGADPHRFRPDPEDRRSGVLFVGRLTPHKGVDRLIRALPEGARLTVAGSEGHDPRPPERGYPRLLRRLAAEAAAGQAANVRFSGPVPDSDLPLLYRRAAVYVLPSVERTCYGRTVAISELLGLSVLEAMASGTPVVASRLGGLPEVVRHGETGILVTPGDVAELRDAIATLLHDHALATRMGQRARETVLQRFTWDACAERCMAAYAELA
jgi:glycosyltransferase involved in cell wall biosynthesis